MHSGTLPLVHAAATWFMAGLIWFVQIVHYPLFARVGEGGFRDYQLAHQSLVTFVVGPAMLVEAVAAGLLLFNRRDPWTVFGAALLAVVWASTAFLQVPLHNALSDGFNAEAHARLVQTNWIRTLGWTARAAVALHALRATE
ncbi:MAG: hypothetical protein ACKV2U_25450 [Bryobacteraceae bacterium]